MRFAMIIAEKVNAPSIRRLFIVPSLTFSTKERDLR